MSKVIPYSKIIKLIRLAKYDLKVRSQIFLKNELTKYGYHSKMKKVHESNLIYLEKFLLEYGWPRPSQYGKEVFEAAWLISIHAIEKRKQMKEALIAIEKLLTEREDVAYQYVCLYDRIALFEGRKQIYGTQLFPTKNGWQALNLEDYEKADKYRQDLGLPTIAKKIQEFKDSGELGYSNDELQEKNKLEEWLENSEWRKNVNT